MLIRDIQVFNKESYALDTWDQSAKNLHSDCFSADVLSYRKKNLEMINNKKKIIYAYKRHKACLKWPC